MSNEKDGYLNFDEYIRQGEPAQRERADAWRVAIGLQAVDGLKTSEYLQETARRNIEGEITIDEARKLVKQYYITKTTHVFWCVSSVTCCWVRTTPLKNRYMMINPPEEWKMPEGEMPNHQITNEQVEDKLRTSTKQAPHKYRTSSSVINSNPDSKFYTNNEDIVELVRIIGNEELSISQMMDIKKLKHRQSFVDTHLEPAMKEKFVRRKYPDRPNHPRQKYLLTVKGLALYQELTNAGRFIDV